MSIFNKVNSNLVKIFSNYFGKLWSFLAVFICIPFYIKYLGIESYGIIGIYTLVVAIISLADAGMASAVTKELSLKRNFEYKVNLLGKVEKIYLIIFSSICFLIIGVSDYLSKEWISAPSISISDLRNYIILIGVGACIQMISSVYYGAIYGIGSQVTANYYQILWVTFKTVLVIFLLEFCGSNLYVFFIWQIICNLLYVFALRSHVNKKINKNNSIKLDKSFKIPKKVLSYIGGMSLISIIAALNSQLDKIFVTSYFDLKAFGYYWVVSYLAQLTIFISIPLASFIFPLLSKYSEGTLDNDIFNDVLKKFINLLYLFLIPFTFLLFYYSRDILIFWLKGSLDQSLLGDLDFLIKFLILGSLFFAMQLPFYYSLLAKSKTKYVINQGFIQVILGVPILFYFSLIGEFKYMGVAFFVGNFIGYLYITLLYFYKFSNFTFRSYLINSLVIPFIISFFIYSLGFILYGMMKFSFIYFMMISFFCSCLCIIITSNLKKNEKCLNLRGFYDFPSN